MNQKLSPGPTTAVVRELQRRDIMAVLSDLPDFTFIRLNTTGEPIAVKRGHRGYYPARASINVERYNAEHGYTAAQVIAMECGSIMGFDVPGADPLNYPELADACACDTRLIQRWNSRKESSDE